MAGHVTTVSVQLLNCARGEGSTISALTFFAGRPSCMVLLLQEPHLDRHHLPPVHPAFDMHCPVPCKPKCVTYIRKLPGVTAHTIFTHLDSFLGTRIVFTPPHTMGPAGPAPTVETTIYNFYSPGRPTPAASLFSSGTFKPDNDSIIFGDFNAHHAWWYGEAAALKNGALRATSGPSGVVAEWFEEHDFTLQNEPGRCTHFPRNGHSPSVIDLCFTRGNTTERVLSWSIDDESTSDHSILGLHLNLGLTALPTARLRRNWYNADWAAFANVVRRANLFRQPINSAEEAEAAATAATGLIIEATDVAAPLSPMREKRAPWWTPELTKHRRRLLQSERRARRNRNPVTQEHANEIRTQWTRSIREAKRRYWNERLSTTTPVSVWATTRRHDTHERPVPPLEGQVTFHEKCAVLRMALYPDPTSAPPPALPDDLGIRSDCDLQIEFSAVTRAEMDITMQHLRYGSAVGPDGISYSTLQQADRADPYILPTLFTALLRFGVHPREWKGANCVITPKKGKSDYSKPKAYRPISLQSCFGKVLEKIVSRRLSNAALKCGAISPTQMGGRAANSAIDALMRTLDPAAKPLSQSKTSDKRNPLRPFLLTHDIEGAFNNVRPQILTQIMARRRMPMYLTNWVESFCSKRTMALCFDGQTEAQIDFQCGVPQGSPLSPALFLIYACVMLDHSGTPPAATTDTSYIDDVNVMQIAHSAKSATYLLQRRTDTQVERAAHLQLQFSPGKSDLLHLVPIQSSAKTASELKDPKNTVFLNCPGLPPTPICPSPSITYLGVIIDERLSFKAHSLSAASKGRQSIGQLMYLRHNTWKGSISMPVCRHLAFTAVLPKMLWASPVWWTGSAAILGPLELTYNHLARWVTGLPKTTAIPKLLAAAHMPPLEMYLDYLSTRYAIRIQFLPEDHVLRRLVTMAQPNGRSRPRLPTPSINGILKFTDPFIGGNLEDRTTNGKHHGYAIPILNPAVHTGKSKRAPSIHARWVSQLPDFTMLLYTDGSKLADGGVGSGWALYCVGNGTQRLISKGRCHLGLKAEVIDAELHAMSEAVSALNSLDTPPATAYICVDNKAAIFTTSANSHNAQYARETIDKAATLVEQGWTIYSVWTPAHCDIAGNEKADQLAKEGAQ